LQLLEHRRRDVPREESVVVGRAHTPERVVRAVNVTIELWLLTLRSDVAGEAVRAEEVVSV
jgi:hypothetical protein